MKILITGITGFIGSHLADNLLDKGLEVYGTTWKKTTVELVNHLEGKLNIEKCDVTNPKEVESLLEKASPDKVFHLAAQSFPTISWQRPGETMECNVTGTINIFEAIKKLGINPTILVACSSAEYGMVRPEEVPVKEERALLPLHPYGVSKVAQDLLAYQYFKNFGMKAIRARIFNTTGPRKSLDACSEFAQQIARIEAGLKEPVLSVGNLDARRDITDGRDMAELMWLASEKATPGEAYNFCSSKAYRISDLVEKLLSMSRVQIKTRKDPLRMRPSDEPIIMGDNSKIVAETGWKPKISIEQTLRDTLDYWRKKLGAGQ